MIDLTYQQFLESKIELACTHTARDFTIDDAHLKPHQRDAVEWSLRRQNGLIAMSFGLGKTRIQCAIAKALVQAFAQPFLMVCPLGVKHQFQEEDGPVFGQQWQYVTTDAEVEAATSPYLITNYERVRDGGIDPRTHSLCGASLDEGSVIRSLGSKTYQVFQDVFADIPHKFVATATPNPNNFRELIYYAEFLGVMDKGQALTRWFRRNPDKAGDLTLMPQHEESFWLWVASWALFLNKPSDLGYSDEGYSLPELRVHSHQVPTDHSRAWSETEKDGQLRLLVNTARGVSEAVREKRGTLLSRVAKAQEIMATAEPETHWLIWHDLEDERRAIEKAIPDVATVYGSQKLELRDNLIMGFAHGMIPMLATKPEIAGSGCNFQRHCHSNIFLGIGFKFQDFIQAVHRTYRFLQTEAVDVHLIYSEAESGVLDNLKKKWQQHDKQVAKMSEIIQQYGMSQAALTDGLKRKFGVDDYAIRGKRFTAMHGDCVQESKKIADNSIGMICTSIPFGNHYEYTTNYEDFGYNRTDEDFFKQMDFLIPELLRVLKPGRVAAVHVKDRILYGHQTPSGFMEVEEFSDDTVKAFKLHGFLYEGRRTIITDVVRENNSSYRLSYGEMVKDASKMGAGLPEYILLFRKPPTSNAKQYADEPVTKSRDDYSLARWQVDADALWRTNGQCPQTPEEWIGLSTKGVIDLHRQTQLTEPYDHEKHVAIGEALGNAEQLSKEFSMLSPKVTRSDADMVWDNVNFLQNLNASQFKRNAANHICPLPFDLVERCIRLYSNEGDTVLDPFGGLFTTPYCAIKLGRHGFGIELNADYFAAGVRYCEQMEREKDTPSLFDALNEVAA